MRLHAPFAAACAVTIAASMARADVGSAVEDLKAMLAGVLGDIAKSVVETQRKLEDVYPISTIHPLHPVFAPSRGFSEEVAEASEGFAFNGDVDRLFQGTFGIGPRVGKETWQGIFGAPPRSYRADVDELLDVTAVLGMNVATSRMRESHPQHKFWNDLYHVTRGGQQDQSAGMAERHMALGIAGIGRVLVEQGETLTGELVLTNLRHQDAEYRRRLALGAALSDYATIAGRGLR